MTSTEGGDGAGISEKSSRELNVVEIVVDTSIPIDNVQQQDSGSNQSGSDSGLGYTNSISSDNSSFTATTGTEHEQNGQRNNINNIVNNISGESKIVDAYSSSEANKSSAGIASVSATSINTDGDLNNNNSNFINANHLTKQTVADTPLSDALNLNGSGPGETSVPIMKSLLKKPSSTISTETGPRQAKSHNRTVSFNQTVIVFCEEIESSSPSDKCEPPSGYQDHAFGGGATFEPPDDYCDLKQNNLKIKTYDQSYGTITSDDLDVFDKAVGDDATGLTDEQLFGLLERESLMDTLKLNCDSGSDDDDDNNDYIGKCSITQLNSNRNYLSNDALSDSESESFAEQHKRDKTSAISPVIRCSNNIKPKKDSDAKQTLGRNSDLQIPPQQQQTNSTVKCQQETNKTHSPSTKKFSKDEHSNISLSDSNDLHDAQKKSNHSQRSTSARMKVSTVDANHSRRSASGRKEEHDVKSKSEPTQTKLENQHQQQQQQQQPHDAKDQRSLQNESTRTSAMMIRQSNVDPVTLFRPVIVDDELVDRFRPPTALKPATDATTKSSTSQSLTALTKTVHDQISNDHYQQLHQHQQAYQRHDSLSFSNKPPVHQTQTGIATNNNNNNKHPPNQSQPACHICKAIETDCCLPDNEPKNSTNRDDSSTQLKPNNSQHQVGQITYTNQYYNYVNAPTSQPAVLNPSCTSCREAAASMQRNNAQNGFPTMSHLPANQPMAYQLVYVVDQKGNRVRALQVVGPAFRSPNAIANADRRILVAQAGHRFPNPSSVASQQAPQFIHRIPQNVIQVANTQSLTVGQAQSIHQACNTDQAGVGQNNNPHVQILSNIGLAQQQQQHRMQQQIPVGMRHHTVYYVRQPLGAQNIRHSFDSTGSGSKSFPDAHEIRRLDGLRAPTTNLNISQKSETPPNSAMRPPHQVVKQKIGVREEEADDPTFGFSKRPSVKVVATNISRSASIHTNTRPKPVSQGVEALLNQDQMANNNIGFSSQGNTNHMNVLRPVSLVLMGSQTLGRRNPTQANQQPCSSTRSKENIPSTSSMSNIHGAYTTYLNKPGTNTDHHQPRISGYQPDEAQHIPPKQKGTPQGGTKLKRFLSNIFSPTNR